MSNNTDTWIQQKPQKQLSSFLFGIDISENLAALDRDIKAARNILFVSHRVIAL